MSRTHANPDPITDAAVISGLAPSPDSPPSPSSPPSTAFFPTPDCPLPTPPSSLPDLSPRQQELLDAFIAARFNVLAFAAAAKLSSRELAAFAADPDVQSHIDAITTLERKSLHVRAIQARHKAITKLELLTDTAEDQIEQRRASTQLLRATSSPIIGACHGFGGASTETVRTTTDKSQSSPLPFALPEVASLPARRLADLLVYALQLTPDANPAKHKARAIATFAAYTDHGATINGAPIPADDADECFESLETSPLAEAANATHHWHLEGPSITPTTAHFAVALAHGQAQDKSVRHTRFTFRLERKEHSRYPGAWLLTTITTEPLIPNTT